MTQEELIDKQKHMRNCVVGYDGDGNQIWRARDVATETIVFHCIDGVWHVLANKRGPGCPNNRGLWNIPSGYLDYNEECEDCAVRETYEETGIRLDRDKLELFALDSHVDPGDVKQNVVAVYWTEYDGLTTFTDANSEKNEVSEIRWIPFTDLMKYNWVSDRHVARIIKAYNRHIANRHIIKNDTGEHEYYGGC